ncbi:MAG: response regulator [Anaerolineae bacterium]|jgi:CheY-like chemotaxis protein|nr:response regulator [Anaerolineae bacterium]MBT7075516.1 response regulator [Anaerolineae bacterium]MBT7783088.1 response regulator [Anaerolineae bacterium]
MKTILILDDEEVIREAFSAYFEDRLWITIKAESAEGALDLLEKKSPDAAVVDIRLPGMSGGEFIGEALLLKPKMVFVICTGSPEYIVPVELRGEERVSKYIFKKPLTKLFDLESELLQLIAGIEKEKQEK